LSMISMRCPPPSERTLMLLSVLWPAARARVPTVVGYKRVSRGSWLVNFGSQRMSREVVSWLAIVRGEELALDLWIIGGEKEGAVAVCGFFQVPLMWVFDDLHQ
jgi:hypothetical protein